MHNHDDKYPGRSGLEPGTSWLQAPVDTNEPSGPALLGGDPRIYKLSLLYHIVKAPF